MNFGILDWAIVIAFLGATCFIGLATRKFIKNYDSYLVAGRKLRLYLAMATMGATELGLVTLMYFSQQGYQSGFAVFIFGLIALLGFLFVGKTGFFVNGLRRMRCRTVTEFFGIRYGYKTQVVAAVITVAAGLLNMGAFLVLGAKFLIYVAGIDPQFLPIIMAGLLALVLLYTVLGGMVSVVATDYLQFILLFTGVILTTWFAVTSVGYMNVIETVQEHYGDGGFNPIVNEGLGWGVIVWLLCGAVFAGGMWPPGVSRALSTTDGRTSQKMYGFIGLSFLGRAMLPMLWGVCAFAYFKLNPEVPFPMENGQPDTASAMPAFLAQILPMGVTGLLTTAALAAMMSTFDSYLLCWSSIIVNDIVVPIRKKVMTEAQKIRLTRIVVVLCGIYVLAWGYLYRPPDTYFRYIAITGTMYAASVLIAIAMGLYWKRANTPGAVVSLVVAGVLPLAAIFVKDAKVLPEGIQWLAKDYVVGILAYVLSILGMVVVSLATAKLYPPRVLKYPEDEMGQAMKQEDSQ